MTEVKSNASHGSVLSGVDQKEPVPVFDMRSWQGLTSILKAARDAEMDATAYASFRDSVLTYAQSGGDPELKSRIEATIATLKKPEKAAQISSSEGSVNTEIEAAPSNRMRTGRPAPVFGGGVQNSVSSKREQHSEPPVHEQVAAVPEPVILKVTPAVSVDIPNIPISDAPEKPNTVEAVLPNTSTEEQSFATLEQHKNRIAEIKRIVHSTIGNPVTLIDAGNRVGRDYMNALLTAMKASGGGSAIGIEQAMSNLEQSFAAVQELSHITLEKKNTEEEATSVNSEPSEDIPPPVTQEQNLPMEDEIKKSPEPEVIQEVKEEALPEIPVVEVVPENIPAVLPEVVLSPTPLPPENLPIEAESVVTPETVAVIPEAEEKTAQEPEMTIPEPVVIPPAVPEIEPAQSDEVYNEISTIESTPESIVEVRDVITEMPKHIPLQQTEIKATQQHTEQSELFAPEVTTALFQLLHEWKIFKSSGLFGIGPGGHEHPLYKTISELPMLTVANGGWDNAKYEDTQSIHDYINAWRHEQGISYNPTENFEHYLRRVIQRILKRQKGY